MEMNHILPEVIAQKYNRGIVIQIRRNTLVILAKLIASAGEASAIKDEKIDEFDVSKHWSSSVRNTLIYTPIFWIVLFLLVCNSLDLKLVFKAEFYRQMTEGRKNFEAKMGLYPFNLIEYFIGRNGNAVFAANSNAIPSSHWTMIHNTQTRGKNIPANCKSTQGNIFDELTSTTNTDGQSINSNMLSTVAPDRENMDSVTIGRRLFTGSLTFRNGGPACIMCHKVTDDILEKGGLLAPELTNVYTRLDEKDIIAQITTPYHITMQDAYKNRQVTPEEAFMLLSFFKQAATKSTFQRQRDQRAAGFLDRIKKADSP